MVAQNRFTDMCIGLTVWFTDILLLSMFGSWALKLLAQPLDSYGSWAESATRWDFTFPIYSVLACVCTSHAGVKASPLWQADVMREHRWHMRRTSKAGFLNLFCPTTPFLGLPVSHDPSSYRMETWSRVMWLWVYLRPWRRLYKSLND